MRSFCRKNPWSIKFLLLGGRFGGGGSADFIFMGARIFLIKRAGMLSTFAVKISKNLQGH